LNIQESMMAMPAMAASPAAAPAAAEVEVRVHTFHIFICFFSLFI
jgi:hypothetical protein